MPESWLLEPENRQLSEDFEARLAADNELIETLAYGKFEGSEWTYFSTELAKYGMAVVGAWMRRGLIFARCRDRGLGKVPELGRVFTDDEVDELTGETVAKALVHFRELLIKKQWDYRKGATLRTYFIGQCLIRFANIYRKWLTNEASSSRVLTADHDTLDNFAPHLASGEAQVINRDLIAKVLSNVRDPRARLAMLRSAEGHTYAEIAVELDVTEKTVERMLANERARLKKKVAG